MFFLLLIPFVVMYTYGISGIAKCWLSDRLYHYFFAYQKMAMITLITSFMLLWYTGYVDHTFFIRWVLYFSVVSIFTIVVLRQIK